MEQNHGRHISGSGTGHHVDHTALSRHKMTHESRGPAGDEPSLAQNRGHAAPVLILAHKSSHHCRTASNGLAGPNLG